MRKGKLSFTGVSINDILNTYIFKGKISTEFSEKKMYEKLTSES
jgi:hypothetical protein